jgi:hypothetical protein
MTETRSFYQPLFNASEKRDLSASPLDPTGILDDNMNLVRIAIRRMFRISKDQDPGEAVKTLAIAASTTSKMLSMLRAREQLKTTGGMHSDLLADLEIALAEVRAEATLE